MQAAEEKKAAAARKAVAAKAKEQDAAAKAKALALNEANAAKITEKSVKMDAVEVYALFMLAFISYVDPFIGA